MARVNVTATELAALLICLGVHADVQRQGREAEQQHDQQSMPAMTSQRSHLTVPSGLF